MISQLEQSRDKNIKKFTGTNPRKADNEIHTQPQVLPPYLHAQLYPKTSLAAHSSKAQDFDTLHVFMMLNLFFYDVKPSMSYFCEHQSYSPISRAFIFISSTRGPKNSLALLETINDV